MITTKLLIATIVIFFTGGASTYKPLIFMHGLFANATEWGMYVDLVNKHHPGTPITLIDAFNDGNSLVPLWKQVRNIRKVVENVMNSSSDGVNMICFSQGGLVCRGLLESMDHNVDTFISISSPQAGQFGDTDYLKFLFPHFVKDNIYKIFYTELGQLISVANYWNDPHQHELYRRYSKFLALLNNQSIPVNPESHLFKKRFSTLKRLVLIGGPDDGVITPWQSAQFGFVDEEEHIVEFRDTEWYKGDSFGLRTLDERGAIKIHPVPGVGHGDWIRSEFVFNTYVLPYLN